MAKEQSWTFPHSKPAPNRPTQIKVTWKKKTREYFLDLWYDVSPTLFGIYHQAFKGSGKEMIRALIEASATRSDNKEHEVFNLITKRFKRIQKAE